MTDRRLQMFDAMERKNIDNGSLVLNGLAIFTVVLAMVLIAQKLLTVLGLASPVLHFWLFSTGDEGGWTIVGVSAISLMFWIVNMWTMEKNTNVDSWVELWFGATFCILVASFMWMLIYSAVMDWLPSYGIKLI